MSFRREERLDLRLPTTVWGMMEDGTLFVEQAKTLDVSPHGARLSGIKHAVPFGAVIGIQHGAAKGRFRVVWVGEAGTESEGQIGVSCIEVGKAETKKLLYIATDDAGTERHRRALEAADYKVVLAGLRDSFQVSPIADFQAILLEWPTTDGNADGFIASLRERHPYSRLILISARPGSVPEAALAHADALVHKGVQARELLAMVEQQIGSAARPKWPITRFSHRYPITVQVEVRVVRSGQTAVFQGRSIDMGEEGVGLTLGGELLPGEIVSLCFSLPTAISPLRLYGTVRHRDGENHGIEFMEISDDQRESVRNLCQALPPLTAPRP